jgi:hypothetical protein
MPRGKRSQRGSAYQQVQRQARALLIMLRSEIRNKEAELKQLKDEAAALDRLGGGTGKLASSISGEIRDNGGNGGRVDWRAILEELPKQFKASDIRTNRAVKNKRPSEVFAAITRWIDAGMVKRKSRGLYERA